jgi:hypothetical protein
MTGKDRKTNEPPSDLAQPRQQTQDDGGMDGAESFADINPDNAESFANINPANE